MKNFALLALGCALFIGFSNDVYAHDCCRTPVRSTVKAVACAPSRVVTAWQEAKPVRSIAARWSEAKPVRSILGRVRGRVRGCCK